MNLHDEMAFAMQVIEPEKAKKINIQEAFPDASGCSMSSVIASSKEKEELSEMFRIQGEMFSGLKESSHSEKKIPNKKSNKFFKNEISEDCGRAEKLGIIDSFMSLSIEDKKFLLKVLIDKIL